MTGERSLADVKAELAALGVQLHPQAQFQSVEQPTGEIAVVMVDRIADGPPTYCVHGFASCVRCDQLCYLGSETAQVVGERTAYPLCLPCAIAGGITSAKVTGHIQDH